MPFDPQAFEDALLRAQQRLLASREPAGHWVGELSSSALATATAVFALHLAGGESHRAMVERGLEWLARNRNRDGGWGDTVLSASNLSTTALCWSALAACDPAGRWRDATAGAEAWIARRVGGTGPEALAAALAQRYGRDRSFSVPILALCALAGRLGPAERAWRHVPPLPFELAALPRRWLKWLRLPTVSYALPALIAMGYVRYSHRPPANPLARAARRLAGPKALAVLERIQPAGGGFLEAAPLTAFVAMSLAGSGLRDSAVAHRAVGFLAGSVRPDGSWPIDTNLATWLTTLSVNALASRVERVSLLPPEQRQAVTKWLLDQQHRAEHPYTGAAPGGWAWTDLPGGVPDADDTAGALLALRKLSQPGGPPEPPLLEAVDAGLRWLLGLQNRDGGIPTFCRGWGHLPFDRSSPDLTAHALRAFGAWSGTVAPGLRKRLSRAAGRALDYLARAQRADGSWVPLWFGNESAPAEENPTYGTARVLLALGPRAAGGSPQSAAMAARALRWLLSARNADGGWGGAAGAASSVEETAVAVEALAALAGRARGGEDMELRSAMDGGIAWLIEHTDTGSAPPPAPIGFYFARLWYFERLYPLIFTAAALGRAAAAMDARTGPQQSALSPPRPAC